MGRFSEQIIDWAPFRICKENEKPAYLRSLSTQEGLGDRLAFVAFAEKQAAFAFKIASEIYDVPEAVKKIWQFLSKEEEKHLEWLLLRMKELSIDPSERLQSLALWKSFDCCETPTEFATFISNAEDRGRIAGEKFYNTLLTVDPKTAKLFQQIAKEEVEHIRLASSVFNSV